MLPFHEVLVTENVFKATEDDNGSDRIGLFAGPLGAGQGFIGKATADLVLLRDTIFNGDFSILPGTNRCGKVVCGHRT
jgi:hypothetical protein